MIRRALLVSLAFTSLCALGGGDGATTTMANHSIGSRLTLRGDQGTYTPTGRWW